MECLIHTGGASRTSPWAGYHDIGILASFDMVAIDQASIDLAFAVEGSGSLQNRVNGRNGLHTLEHAEETGLGSRTYELVNIDDRYIAYGVCLYLVLF